MMSTPHSPALPPVESLSLAELRDEVAKFMGWKPRTYREIGYGKIGQVAWLDIVGFTGELRTKTLECPRYELDIALAMQVARRLRELHYGVRINLNRHPDIPLVTAWNLDTHPSGRCGSFKSSIPSTEDERLPEAICQVAVAVARLEKGGAL